MKKIITALSFVILTACGGGSDNTAQIPYVPGNPPANVYNAMDGSWNCTNDNKPAQSFRMSVAFSGVQAAWSGYWADGHEAYTVYNDKVGNWGATLYYSEKRNDGTQDFNTISFVASPKGTSIGGGQGPVTFSVADVSDWTQPFADKIWTCKR